MRAACKVAHLAEAPYAYALHATSLTTMRQADIEIQSGRARAKQARGWWGPRWYVGAGLFEAAYLHRRERRLGLALRCLARSIKQYPFAGRCWRCLAGLGMDWISGRSPGGVK
jgi:hypothetical protein